METISNPPSLKMILIAGIGGALLLVLMTFYYLKMLQWPSSYLSRRYHVKITVRHRASLLIEGDLSKKQKISIEFQYFFLTLAVVMAPILVLGLLAYLYSDVVTEWIFY